CLQGRTTGCIPVSENETHVPGLLRRLCSLTPPPGPIGTGTSCLALPFMTYSERYVITTCIATVIL
ncbi:hypothetical protein JG688_00003881, partial [Phytophthora aleatoria]